MKLPPLNSLAAALLVAVSAAGADQLDKTLAEAQARTSAAQQSQQRIDQLAEQTGAREQEYKQILKQSEGLTVYLSRLDKQLDDQGRRLEDIEASIAQVAVMQRQLPAVIERMIDALDEFIALDFPFYLDERRQRIEFLRGNLSASQLSVAEKFRQVMEAYQIENDYGRKISAYKGTVELEPGAPREVHMLQVGRIALMYQTTDGRVAGAWDPKLRQWVPLDSGQYGKAIRQALRIAENQAAKDILTVPVAAPEVAR
jgi:hypothetical protein